LIQLETKIKLRKEKAGSITKVSTRLCCNNKNQKVKNH